MRKSHVFERWKAITAVGDGQYHNYTIVWHTGDGGSKSPGWTEFYVDGIYLGTNNAFVPTRGSRFFIAHWYPSGQKNAIWNGRPNDWGGGVPGDGQMYSKTTKISEVRITPFDEPNDSWPSTRPTCRLGAFHLTSKYENIPSSLASGAINQASK